MPEYLEVHDETQTRVRIGEWLVDTRNHRLTRDGISFRVDRSLVAVLALLIRRTGEMLTFEDIEAAAPSDQTADRLVAMLRSLLCDCSTPARFIEVFPGAGCQLVATVEDVEAPFPARDSVWSTCQFHDGKKAFNLRNGVSVIGRAPEVEVFVDDMRASRYHARVLVDGDSAVVEDNQSTNGTFVEGRKIEGPVKLGHGDTVVIGETVLVFRSGPS